MRPSPRREKTPRKREEINIDNAGRESRVEETFRDGLMKSGFGREGRNATMVTES